MMSKENLNIKVYYDGLCHLCSREINHYKKQAGSETIQVLDITNAEFNAEHEGVDPQRVHQVLHVRRADGSLATEVEAFIEIWKQLPRYQWAATMAQRSPVKASLHWMYRLFAKVRPLLPRKAASCDSSPYCEITKQ